jgi:Flp pilus assembly protein TadG
MHQQGGGDEGQATVELALLLPVVAILLLAVLQVAVVARDAVLVTHAAREAARAGAVDASPAAAAAAARSSSGLDPARLAVRTTRHGGAGGRVQVDIWYRSPTDLPIVGALIGDPLLTATVTMRIEQ